MAAVTTVKKYLNDVTFNIEAAGAISEGLFYGVNSSGVLTIASNATPIAAIGFAVKGMASADGANGRMQALAAMGVIDFGPSDIEGGAFTPGQPVYLYTAGKATTNKVVANGVLSQVLGTAVTTTKVMVNISPVNFIAQTAGNSNIGI